MSKIQWRTPLCILILRLRLGQYRLRRPGGGVAVCLQPLLQSAFAVLDLEPCLGLRRAGSRPGGRVVPWADLPAFLQDLLGSAAKALCPSSRPPVRELCREMVLRSRTQKGPDAP